MIPLDIFANIAFYCFCITNKKEWNWATKEIDKQQIKGMKNKNKSSFIKRKTPAANAQNV